MPFHAVCFLWRKQGTTPEQFKAYYEQKHMPLVVSLFGNTFPISHTIHYILREPKDESSTDTSNAAYKVEIHAGQESDFEYDAYAELVFEDKAAFGKFAEKRAIPEVANAMADDESKFVERQLLKACTITEPFVTYRPQ